MATLTALLLAAGEHRLLVMSLLIVGAIGMLYLGVGFVFLVWEAMQYDDWDGIW